MIEVAVFVGESFYDGKEWETFSFPAIPKVGDVIRQVEGPRQTVKEVEFSLREDRTAAVRVLVEGSPKPYDVAGWIG